MEYRDTDLQIPRFKIGERDSLENAVQLANNWEKKNHLVEYGLYIPNPKGK